MNLKPSEYAPISDLDAVFKGCKSRKNSVWNDERVERWTERRIRQIEACRTASKPANTPG